MERASHLIHWADLTADRIIRQLGDKETYTLASGITPSGVVHFGNFREVITTEFVAKALKERGKNVRFIFSWDDYDTFRKVPANLPKQEKLKEYLFQPIVDTPDPHGQAESYAAYHEASFEAQLKRVGIDLEPIYQAKKYRAGDYKKGIRLALEKRDEIAAILNKHRTKPLPNDWQPVSVYCEKCNTDNQIKNMKWDGNALSYECGHCSHQGQEVLEETSRIKLPWRLDWPMRWAYEQVDFEPGGKDHSSQGGSFTTAKEIVALYDWKPPIYVQYDFVSIKGAGGKMSSSTGNLITVNDVLNIYEPEMVRWIFASYKSNVDFAISFDIDVIKTYEDFDRQERLAYGVDAGNAKKVAMAKRVMQLSQVGEMPSEMPFQPAFRHLSNVLQIHGGDIEKAKTAYASQIKTARDQRRFEERAQRAWFWINNYAPEDFKFSLNNDRPQVAMSEEVSNCLADFKTVVANEWSQMNSDVALNDRLYEVINAKGIEDKGSVFKALYQILINKEKGPKLAGFIRTIG